MVDIALKNARIDASRPFRSPIVDRNYVDDIFDRFKPAPVVVRDVSQPRTQRAGSLSGQLREAERRETLNGRQRSAVARLDDRTMRAGEDSLRSARVRIREVEKRPWTERLARGEAAGTGSFYDWLNQPLKHEKKFKDEKKSSLLSREHDERNSDDSMRDQKRRCKERPNPNEKRQKSARGSGSASREFVPWCD